VLITRLRLGRCRLASYLHAIGCHPDGLCNVCNTNETISHLLFECTKYTVAEELKSFCNSLNVQLNLCSVLSNKEIIEIIFKLIKENKLNL